MRTIRIIRLAGALLLAACFFAAHIEGQSTTIDTADRFAWGENIGWTNWRWDTGTPGAGATIGQFVCSGYVFGENVGWINLGDGTPADGIHYSNTEAADFGVNHDGAGSLSGMAWGENIGWITFDQGISDPPRVDLSTGRLAGYAWAENCGWIDLGSNGAHFVKTNAIAEGADTDSDLIADAWEREQAVAAGLDPLLTHLHKTTDYDGDGRTDLEEYRADTDPFSTSDHLRLVDFTVRDEATENIDLEWTSSERRFYDVQESADLPGPFADFTGETDLPGAAGTTGATLSDPLGRRTFFRIEVKMPLTP